ncbi:hypothetical protein HYR99_01185 [Candidatus Poribacteria bacterium]|nr:hypothetical protein [Candidatus Poribacteria bacterium]
MEGLKSLIIRAQAGDMDAFGAIVQRFQDMEVGYAYSILGDFHLAADAMNVYESNGRREKSFWANVSVKLSKRRFILNTTNGPA